MAGGLRPPTWIERESNHKRLKIIQALVFDTRSIHGAKRGHAQQPLRSSALVCFSWCRCSVICLRGLCTPAISAIGFRGRS